jgi:PAS domain S-box-containing protein
VLLTDIDDRKHAEDALHKSEERWRAVFENSAIGVALTDLRGRFLATNRAFQKMLGHTEEEIGSLTFLELTHEDYRESNWQLGHRAARREAKTVSDREAVPAEGRQLDLGKQ